MYRAGKAGAGGVSCLSAVGRSCCMALHCRLGQEGASPSCGLCRCWTRAKMRSLSGRLPQPLQAEQPLWLRSLHILVGPTQHAPHFCQTLNPKPLNPKPNAPPLHDPRPSVGVCCFWHRLAHGHCTTAVS